MKSKKLIFIFLLTLNQLAFGEFCSLKSIVSDSNKNRIAKLSYLLEGDSEQKKVVQFKNYDVRLEFKNIGKDNLSLSSNLSNEVLDYEVIKRYGDKFILINARGVIPNGMMGVLNKKHFQAKIRCPIL